MNQQLLTSKLKMPHVAPHYLRRSRLSERLNQLKNHKLTIVEATAGSGKSMLVADYFSAGVALEEIVWFNVSANCQDPALFWSYLLEGLKPFFNMDNQQEINLLQSQFTAQQIHELLVFLLNQLSDSAFYLIIDDIHLISDQKILTDLEFFIQKLPQTVHCVLLTRQAVPFYYAQWQLKKELLLINQDELALTREELTAFISLTSQQAVSPVQQEELWHFSEGWIGGLQLLLAETSMNRQTNLSNLQQDKSLVYEYLKREIYQQLPKELQTFLLVIVQFSYFDQVLCQALFPEKTFNQWLEMLQSHHIMLQIVNYQQQAYRFHHIFEEFLEHESQQLERTEIQKALFKGVAIFREQGDLEEAIRLALLINDYSEAMPLILLLEQPLKLAFYSKQVPNQAALTNFDFTLQKFFFHYMNGEVTEAYQLQQLAIAKSHEAGQFELFKGMEYLVGEQLAVFEVPVLSTKVIQGLKASQMTKALMLIRNVSVLFYQCRYREALEQVHYNQEFSEQLASDYLAFFNFNIEAQLLEEMGFFNQSLAVYRRIEKLLAHSDFLEQLSHSFKLSYHISILGTRLKQMNIEQVEKTFAEIKQGGLSTSHDDALLYNQVEYWYLSGQAERAWEGLQKLLQAPVFSDLISLAPLLKYAFHEGQLPQQLKDQFKERVISTSLLTYNGSLLFSQLLDDEGLPELALQEVDQLLTKSRKEGVPLKIIEGSLLKIKLLANKPRRHKESQDLYREAVYYGCSNHSKQAFFFAQTTLKRLFESGRDSIEASLSEAELAFHQELVKEWQLISDNPLTERETEVLVELAKGLTNKEIAKQLYISEATVKTHVLNIYRKLEVGSRVAAVEKGQFLKIL